MPLLLILKAWPIIRWALGALGILGPEDKQKEEEYRLKLIQEATKIQISDNQTFTEFMKMTSPVAGSRLADVAGVFTAITRQVFIWAIAVSFVWRQLQRVMLEGALGFAQAGAVGLLLLSFVAWEFYGNKALSILNLKLGPLSIGKGNGNGNGNGNPSPAQPDTTGQDKDPKVSAPVPTKDAGKPLGVPIAVYPRGGGADERA